MASDGFLSIKSPLLIITAPHSKCGLKSEQKPDQHNCDWVSKDAACCLYLQITKKDSNIQKYLLLSDMDRSKIDLNRREAISSKFWIQLKRLLVEHSEDHPVFLIDMHSFPSIIFQYEIFIIDNTNNQPYIGRLLQLFQMNQIYSTKAIGKDNNAIALYTLGQNCKTVLLEFNEDLSQERIYFICSIVREWLNQEIEMFSWDY